MGLDESERRTIENTVSRNIDCIPMYMEFARKNKNQFRHKEESDMVFGMVLGCVFENVLLRDSFDHGLGPLEANLF